MPGLLALCWPDVGLFPISPFNLFFCISTHKIDFSYPGSQGREITYRGLREGKSVEREIRFRVHFVFLVFFSSAFLLFVASAPSLDFRARSRKEGP